MAKWQLETRLSGKEMRTKSDNPTPEKSKGTKKARGTKKGGLAKIIPTLGSSNSD